MALMRFVVVYSSSVGNSAADGGELAALTTCSLFCILESAVVWSVGVSEEKPYAGFIFFLSSLSLSRAVRARHMECIALPLQRETFGIQLVGLVLSVANLHLRTLGSLRKGTSPARPLSASNAIYHLLGLARVPRLMGRLSSIPAMCLVCPALCGPVKSWGGTRGVWCANAARSIPNRKLLSFVVHWRK